MKLLKDIFSILTQKEKKHFMMLIFIDVVISVLDIAFLILLLFIINFYSQPAKSFDCSPGLNDWPETHPLLPVALFFLLFSLKNWLAFVVSRRQFNFVYTTASRISKTELSNYLHGPYEDYIKTDSAVYSRSIGQQPIEFCNYILKGIQQIISQGILIILTVIPIAIYNAALFPLLLLILVPPIILTGLIMKRKLNGMRLSIKKTSEKSGQHLKEALGGFIESNIDNKTGFFLNRYYVLQKRLNTYQAAHQSIQNLPSRLIEIFAVFGLFMLIVINTGTSASQHLTVLTIGAFMAASYKIIPGLVKILNSIGQIKTYSFTLNGLKADSLNPKDGLSPAITSIEFENVAFSFGAETVLKDLSLSINKGDFVCITGASGKGKSTLINLLLGFLQPYNGRIFVNGIPTTALDRQQFWGNTSYVKQQPFLIHDSILKNITLADGDYSAAKLAEVTKITGVDDLIAKSPQGLHTIIREEGKNFSGGQRQRIILARALYKNFSMLILDEPFNELDEDAEKRLVEYLGAVAAGGKIVILITHSSASLQLCDKKIIME